MPGFYFSCRIVAQIGFDILSRAICQMPKTKPAAHRGGRSSFLTSRRRAWTEDIQAIAARGAAWRRRTTPPIRTKPSSIIAQVAGSGTETGTDAAP